MEKCMTQVEMIPYRIVHRNTTYAHRKVMINKKFEWINKYLAAASPKIINPSKFVCASKIMYESRKNKSLNILSRLKTQETLIQTEDTALQQKNINQRKTSYSHVFLQKENKRTIQRDQSSLSKFFRNKKNNTQISTYHTKSADKRFGSFQRKSRCYVEDSQIKPWKMQEEQDDFGCFKENQNPAHR